MPSVWCPTTRMAGLSNGFSKSWGAAGGAGSHGCQVHARMGRGPARMGCEPACARMHGLHAACSDGARSRGAARDRRNAAWRGCRCPPGPGNAAPSMLRTSARCCCHVSGIQGGRRRRSPSGGARLCRGARRAAQQRPSRWAVRAMRPPHRSMPRTNGHRNLPSVLHVGIPEADVARGLLEQPVQRHCGAAGPVRRVDGPPAPLSGPFRLPRTLLVSKIVSGGAGGRVARLH